MSLALVYNGTPIRDRGESLNLTDMWRAGGCDNLKRPAEWLRSAQAKEFIEFISDTINVGISHIEIIQTDRGGSNPATWAHWHIGLAYAKYLSPEFHVWCNEVVRAHMEGQLVPVRNTSQDIIEGFKQATAPVVEMVRLLAEGQIEHRERLGLVEKKVDIMDSRLALMQATVESFVPRRDLSKAVKHTHCDVITRLGGRCPACGLVDLFNGQKVFIGEWDHFYARNRNKLHETWPICAGCNKTRAISKTSNDDMQPMFNAYQARLQRLELPLFAVLGSR